MDERITAYLEKVTGMIEEHGWIIQAVGTNPMLFYTVGLAQKGLPEVVVTGLPMDAAQSVLNVFARKLVNGTFPLDEDAIQSGAKFDDVLEGYKAKLRWVAPAHVRELRVAKVIAQTEDFKALQIVWPDREGRFYGEAGFEDKYEAMQDLTFVLADESTMQ